MCNVVDDNKVWELRFLESCKKILIGGTKIIALLNKEINSNFYLI